MLGVEGHATYLGGFVGWLAKLSVGLKQGLVTRPAAVLGGTRLAISETTAWGQVGFAIVFIAPSNQSRAHLDGMSGKGWGHAASDAVASDHDAALPGLADARRGTTGARYRA